MAMIKWFVRPASVLAPRKVAVVLGAVLVLFAPAAFAGGNPPPANAHSILADLVVVPDADLARQSGTSLPGPQLDHGAEGHPPIVLWDELKPPVQAAIGSGSINLTINGSP